MRNHAVRFNSSESCLWEQSCSKDGGSRPKGLLLQVNHEGMGEEGGPAAPHPPTAAGVGPRQLSFPALTGTGTVGQRQAAGRGVAQHRPYLAPAGRIWWAVVREHSRGLTIAGLLPPAAPQLRDEEALSHAAAWVRVLAAGSEDARC